MYSNPLLWGIMGKLFYMDIFTVTVYTAGLPLTEVWA